MLQIKIQSFCSGRSGELHLFVVLGVLIIVVLINRVRSEARDAQPSESGFSGFKDFQDRERKVVAGWVHLAPVWNPDLSGRGDSAICLNRGLDGFSGLHGLLP